MALDPYVEHVSGTIIGGDEYPVTAAVYYDGRPQGSKIHATSEKDAMDQAKARKQELIRQASPSCYANDSLWELRIYDA